MFPYKSLENNLAKELLRTITVTVPLVHPDYRPKLLSQRNPKTPKFPPKVAVFTRNRTNRQLWQKSQFRFVCKNTTFCEHHKHKQKSQIDWCYGFMKTSFRSCFKFGTFSTNATKRDQIAYERKANKNFNEQQISFPMCKTIRKVTAKQLFELFYFFANKK